MTFAQRLNDRIQQTDSRVCLGIDPRPDAHPLTHPDRFEGDPAQVAKAVVYYFQAIIEASADVVACYKVQAAFFEALGIPGLIAMAQLIADLKGRKLPVILDAKRGDIGSTAEAYAHAYLGDGVFGSDALTVNPYLGRDSLEPFVERAVANGRGLFVLVKTSNPGSSDLQDLVTSDDTPVYLHTAKMVDELGQAYRDDRGYSPLGAVVGATHPQVLRDVRRALPHSILLVPGYGAQGAGADDVVGAFDADGLGAVVNSSRGLSYVTDEDDFPQQVRTSATAMKETINRALRS